MYVYLYLVPEMLSFVFCNIAYSVAKGLSEFRKPLQRVATVMWRVQASMALTKSWDHRSRLREAYLVA